MCDSSLPISNGEDELEKRGWEKTGVGNVEGADLGVLFNPRVNRPLFGGSQLEVYFAATRTAEGKINSSSAVTRRRTHGQG